MKIEIKGLDKLTRDLDELQRALASLDGEIATLKFDVSDPRAVDRAIQEAERAVDAKVRRYAGNPMVRPIVAEFKEKLCQEIRQRAEAARRAQR